MSSLFNEGKIGSLTLKNRLVRSATAEYLADEAGGATPRLKAVWQALAEGGVGLIISGHMYVHSGGKSSIGMTGIYADELIPGLAELVEAVHNSGGKIAAQINHGGMNCGRLPETEPVSASDLDAEFLKRPARGMLKGEIEEVIDAFGQAARRAKAAGFDGAQIHGAHGSLVSQFLSPLTNQRQDRWGGSFEKRLNFLRDVSLSMRENTGLDFPLFIKLGLADDFENGLMLEEGLRVVAEVEGMGLDALEISSGIGGDKLLFMRKGIKPGVNEAYYSDWADQARKVTNLPILLVGGLRSRQMMDAILDTGQADYISLCRPLICEPDLPERLRLGLQDCSICISANNCMPLEAGAGTGCKCPIERTR
ncbi:MAG: NADH:flavin oxidoreductase [Anaerolineaceae bacterium]|nr:NADH:flavin oxidoreductase [Anaerolineaceae bacterium]